MTKNKRLCISFLIILLVVTGCSSSNQQTIRSGKEVTMFVATDIHYLAENLTDNGKAYKDYLASGDGRQLNYVEEIVNAFMNEVSEKKPDILIISGDLTNNGERESHLKLAEKFRQVEETTGTDIFVIPGNHDIQNPWARGFKAGEQFKADTIKAEDFKTIYNDFGYEEAISKDEASLSYLAAPSEDVWLLMLDTNEYELNEALGMPTTSGEISEETYEWIRKCSTLAQEKKARIVTVMHHNLFNHSSVLYNGFTLSNNEEAVKVFSECGLNLILSGHIHIQDIKARRDDQGSIYDIVTSALSMYPEQYGILKYVPSEGFDYSTSRVDVEGWAEQKNIEDENIINFTEYSKNYLADASYQKALESLTDAGIYSDYENKLMAETMSLININYFGGTSSAIKKEIVNTPGYKLWAAATEPEFLKEYVLSMLRDSDIDNNRLLIPNSRQ